jgi:hypothetical protein
MISSIPFSRDGSTLAITREVRDEDVPDPRCAEITRVHRRSEDQEVFLSLRKRAS